MNSWLPWALVSAGAAAATAILAKLGVEGVSSSLATALRTSVVLVFSWAIVGAGGQLGELAKLSGRTLSFLALSGVATGVSWLAYFHALKLGPATRVAPVDKLSLALTVLLAAGLLGEQLTLRLGLGVVLMVAGAILTIA